MYMRARVVCKHAQILMQLVWAHEQLYHVPKFNTSIA